MKTLIILNPHAGSGRAGKLWADLEPVMREAFPDHDLVITQRPEDVDQLLDVAHADGTLQVIAIGGDGTNHGLINSLIRLKRRYPDDPLMTFGSVPIGTGQDWAKTVGMPVNPVEAVKWLKSAVSMPVDAGYLQTSDSERYFLNVASAGIGGIIAQRVNAIKVRYPWTFYQKIVGALLTYQAPHLRVKLDGKVYYDAPAYAVAIANGKIFGRGLRIAPDAAYNDGLFDVVVIEALPRLEAILAMNSLYKGTHIQRKDVHMARAEKVEIESATPLIDLELDGEHTAGYPLTFEVLPGVLKMLVAQSSEKGERGPI